MGSGKQGPERSWEQCSQQSLEGINTIVLGAGKIPSGTLRAILVIYIEEK